MTPLLVFVWLIGPSMRHTDIVPNITLTLAIGVSADVSREIQEIEVFDGAQAEALAFPGSPTIRVDGKDVEPDSASRLAYGLSCRTYEIRGRLQGVPAREWIRDAICAAQGSREV